VRKKKIMLTPTQTEANISRAEVFREKEGYLNKEKKVMGSRVKPLLEIRAVAVGL